MNRSQSLASKKQSMASTLASKPADKLKKEKASGKKKAPMMIPGFGFEPTNELQVELEKER